MFKVVLTTDRHGSSASNPMLGSDEECEGTITSYYLTNDGEQKHCPSLKDFVTLGRSGAIEGLAILWDNGASNSYRIEDISISSTDESVIGICNTIW